MTKTTWNVEVYGTCEMSAAAIGLRLIEEGCIAEESDRVCRYPGWFGIPEICTARDGGVLVHRFYRHLYGHTEYFLSRLGLEIAQREEGKT